MKFLLNDKHQKTLWKGCRNQEPEVVENYQTFTNYESLTEEQLIKNWVWVQKCSEEVYDYSFWLIGIFLNIYKLFIVVSLSSWHKLFKSNGPAVKNTVGRLRETEQTQNQNTNQSDRGDNQTKNRRALVHKDACWLSLNTPGNETRVKQIQAITMEGRQEQIGGKINIKQDWTQISK